MANNPNNKEQQNGKRDCVPFVRGFKPKTLKEQLKAIGLFNMFNKLPVEYDPTIQADSSNSPDMEPFPPIPSPSSIDDWLAQYKEDGQTYQEFLDECPWLSTRKRKNMSSKTFVSSGNTILYKYPDQKIYLRPVGNFDSSASSATPNFDDLIDYAQRFLCLPVVKTDGVKLEIDDRNIAHWVNEPDMSTASERRRSTRTKKVTLTSRYNKQSGHLQLCVDSQLLKLRQLIPSDAICLMGLTMHDLYADEQDLFVAGMAAGNNRVGIFSFYRYNPTISFSSENWYEIFNSDDGETVSASEVRRLILERSCKLLVHELCHLLGIDHCVYFACCMNGSGHLQEDFRQPMHLCPVDLHKLQTLVGFDILERYQSLLQFYEKHNMQDDAVWVQKRIQVINYKKTKEL